MNPSLSDKMNRKQKLRYKIIVIYPQNQDTFISITF